MKRQSNETEGDYADGDGLSSGEQDDDRGMENNSEKVTSISVSVPSTSLSGTPSFNK
jgi:hypothetical protein